MLGVYKNTWMLWIALALVACLPPLDVPPLVALSLSCAVVGWWTLINVSLRTLFVTLIFSILDVFFREIGARNQFKVPQEGAPVLFVCAPHANQFLDPFVVMSGTGRSDVAFLAAATSVRKRVVGFLMRLLESIPVERAQDLAFDGAGAVWLSPEDGVTLLGRGTRFREEVAAPRVESTPVVAPTYSACPHAHLPSPLPVWPTSCTRATRCRSAARPAASGASRPTSAARSARRCGRRATRTRRTGCRRTSTPEPGCSPRSPPHSGSPPPRLLMVVHPLRRCYRTSTRA